MKESILLSKCHYFIFNTIRGNAFPRAWMCSRKELFLFGDHLILPGSQAVRFLDHLGLGDWSSAKEFQAVPVSPVFIQGSGSLQKDSGRELLPSYASLSHHRVLPPAQFHPLTQHPWHEGTSWVCVMLGNRIAQTGQSRSNGSLFHLCLFEGQSLRVYIWWQFSIRVI